MADYRDQLERHLGQFTTAPLLFAGAGLSRRYLGLDDWQGLLRRLAEATEYPYEYYVASGNDDPAEIATRIAEPLHDRGGATPRKSRSGRGTKDV